MGGIDLYGTLQRLDALLNRPEYSDLIDRHVRVIVGIDGPQSLYDHMENTEYLRARQGMSRIFGLVERYQQHIRKCHQKHCDVYFPLLSTQSSIADLSKPELVYPSDRKMGRRRLLPLYLAFPFDLFDTGVPFTTMEECAKLSNLKKLGRPL